MIIIEEEKKKMDLKQLNYTELANYLNKIEQDKKDIQSIFHEKGKLFWESVKNDQTDVVKDIIDWGYFKLFDLNSLKNVNFNKTSPDTLTLLFNHAPSQAQPHLRKLLFDYIEYRLHYTKFEKDSFLVADQMQFCMDYFKEDFVEPFFSQKLKKFWGIIPFDQRHQSLEGLAFRSLEHPIHVFENISRYHDRAAYTLEEIYQQPQYQRALDYYPEDKFKDFGRNCMKYSISSGQLESIQFWLSHYVSLPEDKSVYSDFISQCSKKEKFLPILNLIFDNISPSVGEHIVLRTAIHNDKRDIIELILNKYPADELMDVQLMLVKRQTKKPSESLNFAVDLAAQIYNRYRLELSLANGNQHKNNRAKI